MLPHTTTHSPHAYYTYHTLTTHLPHTHHSLPHAHHTLNNTIDMEQTRVEIAQLIVPMLRDIVADPSTILKLLPRFSPHEAHPFREAIQKANLFATPIGKPDLLLQGLPIKAPPLTAIEASAKQNNLFLEEAAMDVDVDVITDEEEDPEDLRAPTKKVLELSAMMREANLPMKAITLIGVSGCGKTRTLVEVASVQFGLYFVASTGGNGGSRDMEKMLEMLEKALRQNPADAEDIGSRHLYALLLARLLVMDYFCKHAKVKENLPFYWLLLQYRPTILLPTQNGLDVFFAVFEQVVKCSLASIKETLDTLLREFYTTEKTSLYIFSDESQVCLLNIFYTILKHKHSCAY
jgi:hypothetical protein